MATQSERKEATRASIIKAARAIFARDGFAKAPLAEIVEKSGVTTGAVYHHFKDKKGLFLAVAEHIEQEIVSESSAASAATADDWEQFEQTIMNSLEICARPDIQRIVFREAPTIIGPYEWRKIELKYGFGLMQAAISTFTAQGVIESPNPDLTAQILLGALMEAAHFAAMAKPKDRQNILEDGQQTVLEMLRALKRASNRESKRQGK